MIVCEFGRQVPSSRGASCCVPPAYPGLAAGDTARPLRRVLKCS